MLGTVADYRPSDDYPRRSEPFAHGSERCPRAPTVICSDRLRPCRDCHSRFDTTLYSRRLLTSGGGRSRDGNGVHEMAQRPCPGPNVLYERGFRARGTGSCLPTGVRYGGDVDFSSAATRQERRSRRGYRWTHWSIHSEGREIARREYSRLLCTRTCCRAEAGSAPPCVSANRRTAVQCARRLGQSQRGWGFRPPAPWPGGVPRPATA